MAWQLLRSQILTAVNLQALSTRERLAMKYWLAYYPSYTCTQFGESTYPGFHSFLVLWVPLARHSLPPKFPRRILTINFRIGARFAEGFFPPTSERLHIFPLQHRSAKKKKSNGAVDIHRVRAGCLWWSVFTVVLKCCPASVEHLFFLRPLQWKHMFVVPTRWVHYTAKTMKSSWCLCVNALWSCNKQFPGETAPIYLLSFKHLGN